MKVRNLPRFGLDHSKNSINLKEISFGNKTLRFHVVRFEESWHKDNKYEQPIQATLHRNHGNCVAKIKGLQSLDNEFVCHKNS